jgi:hypothetical protein
LPPHGHRVNDDRNARRQQCAPTHVLSEG